MRKEALENIMPDEKMSSRDGTGRLREIILDGLRSWHEGISEFIQKVMHLQSDVMVIMYPLSLTSSI